MLRIVQGCRMDIVLGVWGGTCATLFCAECHSAVPSLIQCGLDVGRAAPTPPAKGWPPLGTPLKNGNIWIALCDHAQSAYRVFVVSHMVYDGLQKEYQTSCGNASIDGERGMTTWHSAHNSIHLGSR